VAWAWVAARDPFLPFSNTDKVFEIHSSSTPALEASARTARHCWRTWLRWEGPFRAPVHPEGYDARALANPERENNRTRGYITIGGMGKSTGKEKRVDKRRRQKGRIHAIKTYLDLKNSLTSSNMDVARTEATLTG